MKEIFWVLRKLLGSANPINIYQKLAISNLNNFHKKKKNVSGIKKFIGICKSF